MAREPERGRASQMTTSTMWCPECGAEYREGMTTCTDCNVALVDEMPPDKDANGNSNGDDEGTEVVVYELEDWTSEERGRLDQRLQTDGIEHTWELGDGT